MSKPQRIYADHGLTGTSQERPGLRETWLPAGPRTTLVVTKLDHLARPLPDARPIAEELTARQIGLSLGGGAVLLNVIAMVAEFEFNLIRLRTREGMKVAKAKGRLLSKQPKLNRREHRAHGGLALDSHTRDKREPAEGQSRGNDAGLARPRKVQR